MKKKVSVFMLIFAITLFGCVHVFATDVEKDLGISPTKSQIESLQTILNIYGYNCGTPDGIMGANTVNGIKQFQQDMGIEVTGTITYELLDYLTAGIPLKVYEDRYNYAVDGMNLLKSVTNATKDASLLSFSESTDRYCPNDNLILYLNPDYKNRKIVGLINIGNANPSVDVGLTYVEVCASLYAFDLGIEKPGHAIEIVNTLLDSKSGKYTNGDIEYTNYSSNGQLLIKGEYEDFASSFIAKEGFVD